MNDHNTSRSFQHLLSHSLARSLVLGERERWKIASLKSISEISERELFMLTISSYRFRVFTVVYFTKNSITEKYVANALAVPLNKLDKNSFYDYIGEVGNKLCGTVKRELGNHLPKMGMSTPNRLDMASIPYLIETKFNFESNILAAYENNILFHAGLYVVSDENFDFRIPIEWTKEQSNFIGDIELF
jgi:hypothetical protein